MLSLVHPMSPLLLVAALCLACTSDDPNEMSAASTSTGGVGGAGGIGASGGSAGVTALPSGGAGGTGTGGAAAAMTGGVGGFSGGMLTGGGGAAGVVAPDASISDAGMPTAFAPCPEGEPCKVLPFGDSITFGIGYSGGYRVELFRRALEDGKSITFTGSVVNGPTTVEGEPFPRNNEGHSGWKIDQVAQLVPDPAFDETPHIVLVMIGTNDVAQNDDLGNAPARLGALIDKLATNAPDALIVVATIIPLSFGSRGVEAYNAALPAVIEERAADGVHVVLVDAYEGFPTSELGDGVHPNQQGYERLAGVFYEAIADLLR